VSLPPGPSAPGILQLLGMIVRPHGFLERCHRRYGDVFTVNASPFGRMVFLADPALIKEAFTGDTRVFHVGGRGGVLRPMLGEHSLLLLEEDEHLRERKLMLPAFHGEALRRHPELIRRIAEEEVSTWRVDEPIELRPLMQTLTLEVILRVVFGLRDPESLRELRTWLERLLGVHTAVLFLGMATRRDISRFPPWRRFLDIRERVDELVYAEIARRRADPEGDDILALLVQTTDESGDKLSDTELRDELMTLVLAGHETTATALGWAFERLARHPRLLERLRASLAEGDTGYLDAVIKEVLRVRPVVMSAGRDLTQPTRIGRWELPAGVRVMNSIALVQRSEKHWVDPKAFDPDRFLSGQPAPYTWIPFGGGTRRCIGASFATVEMATIIPVVLHHFDLRPDRPHPERSRTQNVTQRPARGTRVILTRRRPAPESEPRPDAVATTS